MNRYQFEDLISDYLENKLAIPKRKEFEKRVFENLGNMSELSAIQLVLAEMRSGNKKGGLIGKPLGAGGKKL